MQHSGMKVMEIGFYVTDKRTPIISLLERPTHIHLRSKQTKQAYQCVHICCDSHLKQHKVIEGFTRPLELQLTITHEMCVSGKLTFYTLQWKEGKRGKEGSKDRDTDLHPVLAGVSTAGHPAARNTKHSGQGGGHEGQLTEVLLQPSLEHLRHGWT